MKRFSLKETMRFLVGGGCAVLVDFTVYQILLILGFRLDISKAFSYVAGAFAGFCINKFWTFNSRKFLISEVIKYILLYAFSAFVNTSVNSLILMLLDVKIFAFLSATAASTVINFLGQKFVVFNKKNNI